MNSADFTPEFSAEEITFIAARRYFTFALFKLLPLLRLKGFPESTSDYQICSSDGSELREDNQHQLDGQLVQIRLKFSHETKDHYFSVILTNDENWQLMITIRSSVAPESFFISGIEIDDLDVAYLKVDDALLNTIEDVLNGRAVKTRTQTVYVASAAGLHPHKAGSP